MTKYVTKAEVRSIGAHSLLRRTARIGAESNVTVGTVIQRFMMKINGARDMGQHETAHLNLHIPMVRSSHGFVRVLTTLDGRDATEEISVNTTASDAGLLAKKGMLETYLLRMDRRLWGNERPPTELKQMSLHEFAMKWHKAKDGKSIVRNKDDLGVIFYPYLSPDPNGPDYVKFCKHSLVRYKSHSITENLWRANASDETIKTKWNNHLSTLQQVGSILPQIVTNYRRRRGEDVEEDNELGAVDLADPNGTPGIELEDSQNVGNGLQMNFGLVQEDDDVFREVQWNQDHDWCTPVNEYAEDLSAIDTWVLERARGKLSEMLLAMFSMVILICARRITWQRTTIMAQNKFGNAERSTEIRARHYCRSCSERFEFVYVVTWRWWMRQESHAQRSSNNTFRDGQDHAGIGDNRQSRVNGAWSNRAFLYSGIMDPNIRIQTIS